MTERKRVNKLFAHKPKSVYRSFHEDKTEVKEPPTKEEIENFWKNIWGTEGKFNESADWLKTLDNEYCTNIANKTECVITTETLRK